MIPYFCEILTFSTMQALWFSRYLCRVLVNGELDNYHNVSQEGLNLKGP